MIKDLISHHIILSRTIIDLSNKIHSFSISKRSSNYIIARTDIWNNTKQPIKLYVSNRKN